jgi:DNA invertase Pin-like site-specific DNA recombinase
MKPKRAAAYARVSSFDQNTEAQETALREYVQRRGWTLHKIYGTKEFPNKSEPTGAG